MMVKNYYMYIVINPCCILLLCILLYQFGKEFWRNNISLRISQRC